MNNNPEINARIEAENASHQLEGRHNLFMEKYHNPTLDFLKINLNDQEALDFLARLLPQSFLDVQTERARRAV